MLRLMLFFTALLLVGFVRPATATAADYDVGSITISLTAEQTAALSNQLLEIGGPSPIRTEGGVLLSHDLGRPVYLFTFERVGSIDTVTFEPMHERLVVTRKSWMTPRAPITVQELCSSAGLILDELAWHRLRQRHR